MSCIWATRTFPTLSCFLTSSGSFSFHLRFVCFNCLFVCRYTQVARILSPIVICLDRLPELCEQPKTCAYIDTVFGGIETTRKDILVDFFKSAFDGSGADNFFDAGSCIDGEEKMRGKKRKKIMFKKKVV